MALLSGPAALDGEKEAAKEDTSSASTGSAFLDTTIPAECVFEDLPQHSNALPSPFLPIPSTVSSLTDCAKWHIEQLEQELLAAAHNGDELEDALDDGFVLCDLNVIRKKLLAWRHLFPRIKPFFALKCNPDPMVAAVLGRTNQAAGFDCASLSEITLALQSSRQNNSNLVVYANPQRAENDLEASLSHGVVAFTLDGEEELHKIHRAFLQHNQNNNNAKKAPQIILRLLVPDEHSTVPLGEKFGAPPDRIPSLVQLALVLQLPIIGVSFHCGSGCHDPMAYAQAIRLAYDAMNTIDELQHGHHNKCWLLDIGGGFPGRDGWKGDTGRFCNCCAAGGNLTIDNSSEEDDETLETARKIAEAINPLLDELFPPATSQVQVISEPGRYFVEAAFALCSRIYRVHTTTTAPQEDSSNNSSATTTKRIHYTIAQGVQGVFKDVVLCGESFEPVPLQMMMSQNNASQSTTVLFPSTIHGPTGDVVCPSIDLPQLQVGDWLLFDRMGAYTLSISARSGRPPIRYIMGS
ncbi:Ornithine decarboxylase [Seminavis robusta]|uniref:Ornithine decarboxylase n=1 Tax=Seminavis robusta TaxID=568900 RepID=A0A9N8HBX8_9STRA|nr:Ornithine decarboxylase [Seminavis robusta]|eukprot:Sro296_g110700.1 Ornithine decarboxylase (522) ;mRNA; f:41685-43352